MMKCGYVRTPKGQVKPFYDYRHITRGRKAGLVYVRQLSGYPKHLYVYPAAIRRYPEREDKYN